MALTESSSRPAESDGVIPAEWPAQAADTIVDTIAKVRDKTTKPALVAARAAVYGILIAVVGTVALILFLVLAVRLWGNYVPRGVWTIYAILAVLFAAAGVMLMRKAARPSPK